ncbi:DUF4129 domain-containing protein [Flavobacterium sp. ANB]|uniref:DUF4129 domain-containing protein n=1 Tax=unclassified Flavobacterium TaxID=196869 RepID=UPI0012B7BCBE|nr:MULTISPECIES: DUF4129 domain-containing protein [unclassified Flavobacterium]MBF4516279.1 DUF4129 domain-containing protein [Flavobacterium sp. ANB]MTD69824.1 DUF4129 domain-containing protein [Flavobacterium sp. LC2016-13]
MNKIFFVLSFLFCCSISNAQDSLATTEPPKIESVKYTEKDIKIDSDSVEARSFSKNFKKKYTDSDFVYEQKVPEKTAWDHFKEWLASIFRKMFSFNNPQTALNFVVILLRVIAILIIVFVIYLIVKAIIAKEGQWIFGKNVHKKTIYYSEIEKNIHLLDFEKLIKESIQSGERRIAIRYYYLWLLKIMAQNHYIEWDIEKTNSDYLYEIQSPVHREEFTYLSYLYNHIWYGEFEIDETTFVKTENRFKKSLKTFSNE